MAGDLSVPRAGDLSILDTAMSARTIYPRLLQVVTTIPGVLDESYSLGCTLTFAQLRSVAARGGQRRAVNVVLTAEDVAVEGFYMSRCSTHGASPRSKNGRFAFVTVGKSVGGRAPVLPGELALLSANDADLSWGNLTRQCPPSSSACSGGIYVREILGLTSPPSAPRSPSTAPSAFCLIKATHPSPGFKGAAEVEEGRGIEKRVFSVRAGIAFTLRCHLPGAVQRSRSPR